MITELPKNWIETNLGTVTTKPQYGWTTKSQNFGEYKYLRTTDIGKGNIKWNEVPFCVDLPKNVDDYILSKNDIVISRAGSIGFSYLVEEIGSNVLYASYLIRFKPLIYPKLISYFLQSNSYWKAVSDSAVGIAVKNINAPKLQSIPFPLPPLPEQERIVVKLDALFAQHETMKKALDHIPQLLKDFRQQVLTQAITGKLTNVPDMQMRLMSDFFDVKTGATPKKGEKKFYENANIYWIKSGEVKNSYIYKTEELITELAVKTTNAKIFPKDTILIAMYGEGKTRGQIGWMKIEAATNQAIAALVNENLELITRKYIYLYCLSQYNEIRAKAEGGNQPNLNLSKIKNWEITIPKLIIEQEKITNRVENLFAKADIIEERYKTLKEKIDSLPQAILHKAFKGELVPQLPSDGDAKDLLEEILKLKKEIKKK